MKKVIVAIISLSFLLTLSGCKMFSYWGGMTRNQCEKYVTEQLKEKYNEEFTVVKFIKTGSGELKGVCAPKRDESLLFDIELDKGYKDELELDDAYIQGIVRDEMLEPANAVLSKHFNNYAVEIWVKGLLYCYESGITDASKASIETYTEALPEDNMSDMWIAVDESETSDFEEIEECLLELSENYHKSRISISCYIASKDVIDECNRRIADNHFEFGHDMLGSMGTILGDSKSRAEFFYAFREPRIHRCTHFEEINNIR